MFASLGLQYNHSHTHYFGSRSCVCFAMFRVKRSRYIHFHIFKGVFFEANFASQFQDTCPIQNQILDFYEGSFLGRLWYQSLNISVQFKIKIDLVLNSFLERTWPRGGEIFSCICVRVPVCVCSYCTYVDVSACVFVLCWRLCQIGDRRLQKVLSQNSYIKYVVQLRCTAQGRARIDVRI